MFTKKSGDLLSLKVYLGGHQIEFEPLGDDMRITKDGANKTISDMNWVTFAEDKEQIFT